MIAKNDISAAYDRIGSYIRRTPVISLPAGDFLDGVDVTLKLEQLQHASSFKPRGAFNALLSQSVPSAGAIAASGGNHGAAVAFAARRLGYRAEIFVPEIVSPAKKRLLESYGATLNVVGREFAEALEACQARQAETSAVLLHAYDQPDILAGQGTVGLEFEAQAPDVDTYLIAVGGGGLIGGVASWLCGRKKVVAVETVGTPCLNAALEAGHPVDVTVSGPAADSLGARRVGELGFAAAQAFVSESVLVGDDAVRAAQRLLWDRLRLIAEPGGATALAALVGGAYRPEPKERVGVLVCGGNTDPAKIAESAS
ncbi:MAG: threonine/serine dehydratase [Alphaproteobacteria bacterium]|nr:threonine/serine dehydratase [Alphaproteobacteria bacterium]